MPARSRTIHRPSDETAATRRRRQASAEGRRRAARRAAHRRPRLDASAYRSSAERRLRRFRQGSAVAVAVAALLLLIGGAPVGGEDGLGPAVVAAAQADAADPPPVDPGRSVDEAAATVRELAYGFYGFLPRLVVALVVVAIGGMIAKLGRVTLERTLRGWERAAALTAVVRLVTFLAVGVVALSILAGDAGVAVGSVGLVGLAASWALQTPIESFTGWLLNSFRGYYRVGDRIAVGDVFGDVYRIDVMTTTVWEAGGPGKAVTAAQPTGAIVSFPNWEVLRSNIVNYSRDFPYVWEELAIGVANESDLAYCASVLEEMARRVLGDQMAEAVQQYERLLRAERLTFEVEELPKVFLSTNTSWTDCTLRYLVPVRSRRAWSSKLLVEASREMARPEHRGRIVSAYPRTEVNLRRTWNGDTAD